MNYIEMENPNFVALETFKMSTKNTEFIIIEGEPLTLSMDKDDNLIYGSGGSVLRISHATGLSDLLGKIRPATFELKVEEDSELSLVASLKETSSNLAESFLESLPLLEHSFGNAIEVHAIRSTEI
jgi:hypothetical protein